jgi:hypothetical protein
MPVSTVKLGIIVLLVIAVPGFVFFVPIVHLPYSDHTICRNFGAYCQNVAQYGSLSYILLCTGAIYQTDGTYWTDSTYMYG